MRVLATYLPDIYRRTYGVRKANERNVTYADVKTFIYYADTYENKADTNSQCDYRGFVVELKHA